MPNCATCNAEYPAKREALGYKTCLSCGDKASMAARKNWTITLAGHKQGYTIITDKEHLKGVNKYAAT